MKENFENILKNVKNLKINFKTTVALLTMSSVLALTGCNGIQKANTEEPNHKAAYEQDLMDEQETTSEKEEINEVVKEEETEKEEIKEEEEAEVSEFDQIDLSSYVGYKLEQALMDAGYKHSFDYRKQIAEHFEIENYKGTAAQNLEILEKLGATVTVDRNASSKTNNQKEQTVENLETKENQENIAIGQAPSASSNTDEKTHSSSGSHGNGGDKTPSNPTPKPDKPAHVHSFNNWVSKDDTYEESTCSCGEKSTREHKYNRTSGTYQPNNNGTHSADVVDTCINCGHTVAMKKTENCNYATIIAKDDTNETKQCACGDTQEVLHVWDNGVLDADNNTVYTCVNPGCGYSYKVEHHIVEETKEKKSQADLCRIVIGKCTIEGCGKIIYTIEDKEHDFFVEKDGLGLVADKLKCHDCDYRTEDPNFVPSTPVIPPMPDDEEEEASLYSIDSLTEMEPIVENNNVTTDFMEPSPIEETEYEVISGTSDYSDESIEFIINTEDAILPTEDEEEVVEEESTENVLKLSL